MNRAAPQTGRNVLDGTVRVLAAEALFPLTALVTAAFLTHRLGKEGYGLLTLTVTLVGAIQWTIAGFFSRATVHHISQAQDWRPVGTAVVRANFLLTLVAGAIFALLAAPVARLLGQPELAPFLCLFAVDIPLFGLALAHKHILTGLGRHGAQAVAAACRWLSRLVFVIVLVEVGLSIHGALVGMIGATVVQLVVSRCYVRVPFLGSSTFRIREMAATIAPLFFFSLLLRVFTLSDVVLLKVLGGTIGDVGVYGAALNLTVPLALVAGAMAPTLLSGMSGRAAGGDLDRARTMGRNAVRAVLLLLPFAALVCGAAPEFVPLVFGEGFREAAPLFVLLAFAAVMRIFVQVASVIFTAAQKPNWCVGIGGVLVAAALVGHFLLIPLYGPMGAAFSTLLASSIGGLASLAAVSRLWRIAPPVATLVRCSVLAVAGYALPYAIGAQGLWVVPELIVCAAVLLLALLVSREFSREEIGFLRSALSRAPEPAESVAD